MTTTTAGAAAAAITGSDYVRGFVRWRVRPCLAFAAWLLAAIASGVLLGGGLPGLFVASFCACAAFASFAHLSSDYAGFGDDGTAHTARYARWHREHRLRKAARQRAAVRTPRSAHP